MTNFAQRLERHCTLDAHTAELLERAAREPQSAVDAGSTGSESASLPVLVGSAQRGDCVCAKCGNYRYGREPWCQQCAQDNAAEYAAVFRAWVLEKREQHLAAADVPLAFQRCGIDNFEVRTLEQRRALDAVKAGTASDMRLGLFLHGPVGVGKTHLAVGALLELLARRCNGRYVSARELVMECRESFVRKELLSLIVDRYLDTGVLVLDDLSERSTEFSRETMELVIDRAYSRRRPQLIVTSNLDLNALGRRLDPRIPDRLRELCQVVKISGVSSYRRQIADRREREGRGA